ncbi:MAG: DUF1788 domain-containing protein [Myxococcales bacterium]|nr:DUF1788 domain-containing protein [Myxococcales bacterium]
MSHIDKACAALRKDLIHKDGPRISTMRNYRFAILQYPPDEEFRLRSKIQSLTTELVQTGNWTVLTINLQQLLLQRIRAQGEGWAPRVMEMERRMAGIDPKRGLNYLTDKITQLIEGPEGIAADCSRIIQAHAEAHPEKMDQSLALIGRAGALYPFLRSSALLRHLDGRTSNIPVVLLYPGTRKGQTGLSFMGKLAPDNDYRPRIYP